MKVVCVVQARMGASRLPGKMMKKIGGKPIVAYVFDRVRLSKTINELWLATTTETADDILESWAKNYNVRCFRGNEKDVLDRYYQVSKLARADVVVRVTGDCPLIDPQVIDKTVQVHLSVDADYTSNSQPPTYPDGLDVEVFNFSILERAWREAKLASEREHVTSYIWNHTNIFKLKNITNDVDLSSHRWTLDTPEDLEFIRMVVKECNKKKTFCGLNEILDILHNHPEWRKINSQYKRNEGYIKSINQDKATNANYAAS